MPDLTNEEKRILRQAYEIKERMRAEKLEAGEISLEEAEREARADAAARQREEREAAHLKEVQAARAKAAQEARQKAANEAARQKTAWQRRPDDKKTSQQWVVQQKNQSGRQNQQDSIGTAAAEISSRRQPQQELPRRADNNQRSQVQQGTGQTSDQNGRQYAAVQNSAQPAQRNNASGRAADADNARQQLEHFRNPNSSNSANTGTRQNNAQPIEHVISQNTAEGRAQQQSRGIAQSNRNVQNTAAVQPSQQSRGIAQNNRNVQNTAAVQTSQQSRSNVQNDRNVHSGAVLQNSAPEQNNNVHSGLSAQNEKQQAILKKQQEGRQRIEREDAKLKKEQEAINRRKQELEQKKEAEAQKQERNRQKQEKAELRREKKKLKQEMKALKKKKPSEEPVQQPTEKKKKKSLGGKILKILLILLLIVAMLLAGCYVFLRKTIAMTDYSPYETGYVRDENNVLHEAGVKNILLIGLDSREAGTDRNSDAMLLLSINSKKRRIVMTSIMRDSYVNIPGRGMNRINAAYTYGGAALLVQTIEENYKIAIDNYVKVDFFSFVDVIDALGGVTVNVQQKEVQYIDGYISEYNHILGLSDKDGFLDELFPGGEVTLTGKQALGYVRIRYGDLDGEDYDFGRTKRQRVVMNAIISKVRKSSPITLYNAVQAILPDLTTDISDDEMCLLLMKSVLYLTYDMQQSRCPADGTYSNTITESGQEVLSVDFEANKAYLKSTIYD